jgi:Uma2 family endonuclease
MRLPEGFPAELVDGELIKEPSPTYGHQRLVQQIFLELHRIVGPERVVISPMDVFIDDQNVLQPDVLVVRDPLPRDAPEVGIPVLVVEVLSPSTADRDLKMKTRIYLRAGVEEVWLVDPESESIEIHTSTGVVSVGPDEAAASRVVPGFALTARSLFGD